MGRVFNRAFHIHVDMWKTREMQVQILDLGW